MDVGLRGASDDATLIEGNKGSGGSAIAEPEKMKPWRGNEDDKAGESETRDQQKEKEKMNLKGTYSMVIGQSAVVCKRSIFAVCRRSILPVRKSGT